MRRLRNVIFWIHLSAGLTAGLIVAVMSLTGAALALQPQIIDWAESSSRTISPPPPGSRRLGLDEILSRATPSGAEGRPSAVTFYSEENSAVRVSTGRSSGQHVDPYTGQTRPLAGQGWRDFFQWAVEWHRYLGTSGDNRPVGKAITGAANAAFLFLALSGLYLWWPRRWSERALRLSYWFRRGLSPKTRDWNWHNVIGFWSLPVLVVITFSGMMISYRPVSNLIFRLAGEAPPAGGGPGAPSSPVKLPPAPVGANPLVLDELLGAAERAAPGWKSLTWRLPERKGEPGALTPVVLAVKDHDQWPLFGTNQLTLDPTSGAVLRQEGYAGYTTGRKVRTWLRFLHTGEALGLPGQLLAGLISLTATLLVWTGMALAYRRLFRRRPATAAASESVPADPILEQ